MLEIRDLSYGRAASFLSIVACFWLVFISSGVLFFADLMIGQNAGILLYPVYLTIAVAAMFYNVRFVTAFLRQYAMVAYVLLAFLSYSWSLSPDFTLNESGRLALHCITAVTLVIMVGPRRSFDLLALAATLGAVLSIVSYRYPAISYDEFGLFRGVYQQKNIAGFVFAIGLHISLSKLLFEKVRGWDVFSITCCLTGIILTKSASSMSIVIAASSFSIYLRLISRREIGSVSIRKLTLLVVLIAAVGGIAFFSFSFVLELFGKDPTLTGRTELWDEAYRLINERPILGFGYQFLSDVGSVQAVHMLKTFGPHALQFHNSYINIMTQFGLVGISLNIIWYFNLFACLLSEARNRRDPLFIVFYGGVLMAVLLQSVSESTFGAPRSFPMFVMIVVFVSSFVRKRGYS